jgi:sodium-dependent dicarboxylate transporter 2/3/5
MSDPNPSSSGPNAVAPLEVPADQTPLIVRQVGLVLGVALFLMTFFVAPPEGMSEPAWRVCGLALWMAVWWISEAMPLPVTALLPLVVLPL